MITKVVYVLVSSVNDLYLEQAYVSMYSVKHYQPDAHIVLLTDRLTNETFVNGRENELKYVDELIVADLDGNIYDAHHRSRILKTSARNYVTGDFLFIDTDTIVVKPLIDIDQCEYDIAACRDTHSEFENNPYREMCLRDGNKLNWPIESEKAYYNSGVIYCKDNQLTRSFYSRWLNNWQDGINVGVGMDQPSFAKTNYELGHIVDQLPDVWNCQVKHGVKYLKNAYIYHYLCTSTSSDFVFLLNDSNVFKSIKKTGVIDDSIKATIEDPFNGISSPTHIFSGNDLALFQSDLYRDVYTSYINGKLPLFYKFETKVRKLYDRYLCFRKNVKKGHKC